MALTWGGKQPPKPATPQNQWTRKFSPTQTKPPVDFVEQIDPLKRFGQWITRGNNTLNPKPRPFETVPTTPDVGGTRAGLTNFRTWWKGNINTAPMGTPGPNRTTPQQVQDYQRQQRVNDAWGDRYKQMADQRYGGYRMNQDAMQSERANIAWARRYEGYVSTSDRRQLPDTQTGMIGRNADVMTAPGAQQAALDAWADRYAGQAGRYYGGGGGGYYYPDWGGGGGGGGRYNDVANFYNAMINWSLR